MSNSNLSTAKKTTGRPVDPNSKFRQATAIVAQMLQDNASKEDILNAVVAQVGVKLSSAKVYFSKTKNPSDPNRVVVKRNRSRKDVSESGDQTGIDTSSDGGDSSGVNISAAGNDDLNADGGVEIS